jgi:glutaryl-CoA dehydrogenase
MWITNGTIADVAVVWADTEDGVRGFLIEKDTPGYTTRDIHKKYSLRASITSELFFDDVRVPDSAMLPKVKGLKGPLSCLTNARYGIAWGVIGSAIACHTEVLEYSKVRELFGRPLATTQAIQLRLANMSRRISTSQLLALQLGRMKDNGTLHHAQVSMGKWNNVRAAIDIARDARDMLGASGISIEFNSIRHMLNLESVITYEGTETIHELVVGRQLTGFNAF